MIYGIDLTSDEKESWIAHIEDFKTIVYPIFARHGIPLADALIIWDLNRMNNRLRDLTSMVEQSIAEDSGDADDDQRFL